MADPMTPQRLDELVDVDPLRLRDAAVALLAERDEARAEVERLRAKVTRSDEEIVEIGLGLREALDAPRVTIREAIDQIAALRAVRDELAALADAQATAAREAAEDYRDEIKRLTAERDAARKVRDDSARIVEKLRAELDGTEAGA